LYKSNYFPTTRTCERKNDENYKIHARRAARSSYAPLRRRKQFLLPRAPLCVVSCTSCMEYGKKLLLEQNVF